jgi:hypothetical protein
MHERDIASACGGASINVAFAESMTMGQNIFEWNADKKAMAEIKTLTRELVNYGKEELSERTENQKRSIA